jgi:KDO2-lipid IV(A) lauroyltransferase
MYFIFYAFFYLISLLPWRVFYILSDMIAFLLQHVIRYRVEVVKNNLAIAFPEKPEAVRAKIAKEFYSQFVDSFVETIKLISISHKTFEKRFSSNYEVVNELYKTGQNVQIMTGHFFSWEFANWGFSKYIDYPFLVVYMPLSNRSFNKLILDLRSRYGSVLIPATNFKTQFHNYVNKGTYALALAADQNPGNPLKAFWVNFFGKPTPFVKGPEKGAVLNNTAQVFVHFYRTKRGYYHSHYEVMTTTPKSFKEGELTAMYVRLLEEKIKQEPANYLWSHRRWKYEFDAEKHSKLLVD